jgi:hypothetical protein
MIFTDTPARSGGLVSSSQAPDSWRWLVFVLVGLMAAFSTMAEDRDGEFLRIYGLIQDADTLDQNGQTAPALAKYRTAQAALQKFRVANPDWNTKVAAFRANYLTGKVAALTEKLTPKPAETESGGSTTAAGGSTASKVKLLEAGAEPRKVLRLHPKPDDKQTVTMTIKMAMEMGLGETKTPMKLPPMTMVLDLNVKGVSPGGDITYETVTTDVTMGEEPGVLPQIAAAMKTSIANLKGSTGKGIITDRGLNKSTEFQAAAAAGSDPSMRQATDQMKEALSGMTVPLPEEAVGPGAKWEVRLPLKSQGMTMEQTTTYTLVNAEEEKITTKAAIVQRAGNQKVSNPAMPGVKLDLTKMSGTGTGETTFDLSQLGPQSAAVESHSEVSMAMNAGGQKQAMTVKIDLNVQIEGK